MAGSSPAGRAREPGREAAVFHRLDPVTGQTASTARAMRRREVAGLASRAARAFPDWAGSPPGLRRAILNRAAALVDDHAARIAAAMRAEIGATDHWIGFNLSMGRRHLEAAADLVTRLAGEVRTAPAELSLVLREPAGVCLAMAPWNAPFVLALRAVAPALACANTVVLKASEICPATHLLVGEILARAGLPEDVLNIVTHAPEHAEEVVGALIDHPAVRRVNFTGSTRVGRIVAAIAARHPKRCLLELGSKAPLVVLEDADLDAAADAAALGSFLNQGQICMATDRIVVIDRVADAFAARLAGRAARLLAGDPRQGAVLGPLVSPAVGERMEGLVRDAMARGARLLAGGPPRGVFMDATVLDGVAPGMALYDEECFGPVASICRARTENEAIGIANGTSYGLTAAIFSRDSARALALARRIDSGMCHINGPTLNDDPHLPFGGVGDSGHGRFGGPAMLDEFTELRWIGISTGPRRHPFLDEGPSP